MDQPRHVFLTGGAGYIGKCTAVILRQHGYEPVALDNFSTSAPFEHPKLSCVKVDLTDPAATRIAWNSLPKPHAVIHFAAKALVPESCEQPAVYFHNNVLSALNVAQMAASSPGCHFLHSSSCAVYGVPKTIPITEETPQNPSSPYGESKRMVEQMLSQFRRWKNLSVLNLRYFNPAGALQSEGAWVGESHDPETHLIPNLINAVRNQTPVKVFGTDYPTPDGSCLRDFIHIEDLAMAHLRALEYLQSALPDSRPEALNVGAGKGVSVLETIALAKKTLGRPLDVDLQPRRPGDPPALVADIALARRILKWQPSRSLEEMITSHFQYLETRR